MQQTTNVNRGAPADKSGGMVGKIISGIGTILCLILIPILLINVTLIAKGLINPNDVPSVFGKSAFIVLTDSMNPDIKSGDLIITQKASATSVQVGDVISFFDPDGNGTSVVTHQVIDIDYSNGLEFQTKGTNNNTPDKSLVPAANVIGIYKQSIPKAGSFAMFMQTTQGMLVTIGIPFAILLILYFLQQSRLNSAKKRETEQLRAELEQLRAGR